MDEYLNNSSFHDYQTGVAHIRVLPTNHCTTVPWEYLLSETICSKVPCKDGGGWVRSCGWDEENGAGGRINRLKPSLTAGAISCRSYRDIDELGAEADTVAGGG